VSTCTRDQTLRAQWQQTRPKSIRSFAALSRRPQLQPDDYTKLASIFVVDACLRHDLLDAALEVRAVSFTPERLDIAD
jgi:hypothetical protein